MIFSIFFPLLIGISAIATGMSTSVKLLALSMLVGGIALDYVYSTSIPWQKPFKSHLLLAALLGGIWLYDKFANPHQLEQSALMPLVIACGIAHVALFPLFRRTKLQLSFSRSYIGIGISVWLIVCIAGTLVGLNRALAVETYGFESDSVVSGQSREVLFGFTGVISGGVFSALVVVFWIATVATTRNKFIIPLGVGIIGAGGIGIYKTDTRSAFAVVLLTSLVMAAHFALRLTGGQGPRPGSRLALRGFAVLILVPFFLPLIAPWADELLLASDVHLLPAALSRGTESSIFQFGGRTEIWRIVLGDMSSDGFHIANLQPLGELASGVADVLHSLVYIPGQIESAHSHNAVLNIYHSYGFLGVVLLAVALRVVYLRIARRSFDNRDVPQLVLLGAMLIFMIFESVFSIIYVYFSPVFIALLSELFYVNPTKQAEAA
jgi:hypothetical protein